MKEEISEIRSEVPKTPPSSQRASRGGKGAVKAISNDFFSDGMLGNDPVTPPTSSPSKDKGKRGDDSVNSSPSKKANVTPSKGGKGQKWEQWEDNCILKEMVAIAEKGINWHQLLADINANRPQDEPRSIHSLKFHWIQKLKKDLLQ